jgi:hypothetical protein
MGYQNKVSIGKTIGTHAKILDCGKMGETIDPVVTRIVDYYREKALGKK